MEVSTIFLILCAIIILIFIFTLIVLFISLNGYFNIDGEKDPPLSQTTLNSIIFMNEISIIIIFIGIIVLILQCDNILKNNHDLKIEYKMKEKTIENLEEKIKNLDEIIDLNKDNKIKLKRDKEIDSIVNEIDLNEIEDSLNDLNQFEDYSINLE